MPRNVAEAEVEVRRRSGLRSRLETQLTMTGGQLNRYHQLFLQAMLLRRALPRSKVIEIWIRCGDILGSASR